MIGQTLGHFRIEAELGRGGMGEVYLAEDSKLHRKVALKILPAEMAADPERRARFEREARAIAALNHPNIVTIHSVEEAGGHHFITMELVRGKSLAELIPRGGLSPGRLFEIAVPIAEALAAAHKQGITHRDLKPANIMVNESGQVKVLDFGLAKLADLPTPTEGATHFPTATVTQEGKIIGTVAYMSPEQAEGKPVDSRSDLFSMGIILYEMATGRRPFSGDTPVSTITSILRDEPASVTDLNVGLPRHLGRIVKRCLAKDPDRRFQSALDLRNELEDLKGEMDSGLSQPVGAVMPSKPSARRRWMIAAGGGVIVVAAALIGWALRGGPSVAPATGTASPVQATYTQLTSQPGEEMWPFVSPDGNTFVYTSWSDGDGDIYLQRVGGSRPVNLTEDASDDDYQPAFSPDGQRIAFRSERDGGGIFVMGSMGGSVRRLTDFGRNPAWSPDGTRIALTEDTFDEPRNRNIVSPLWIVDVETGATTKVFDGDAAQPSWSPDGTRIAFWRADWGTAQRDLATIAVSGGDPVPLTDDPPVDWNPIWSPDGRFIYFSSDRGGVLNLWRMPIDPKSGKPRGEPVPVTTPASWAGMLSISSDGRRVLYSALEFRTSIDQLALSIEGGRIEGPAETIYRSSRQVRDAAVSPDGERIAFVLTGTREDVFVMRRDGSDVRQLTDDAAKDRGVSWGHDGRILFYTNRTGQYEIWGVRPDGSGLAPVTENSPHDLWFPQMSADGTLLAYFNDRGSYIVDLTKPPGEREHRELPPLEDGAKFRPREWSGDGKALLGNDQETEGAYLYFPETNSYRRLSDVGGSVGWLRQNDTVLQIDNDEGARLIDVQTGEITPLEVEGLEATGFRWPRITRDGKHLVYAVEQIESDIWMATLD